MREAEDFFPFVRTHVPGAPDLLVEQQIVLAARDFCRRTRMWRETSSFDVTGEAVQEALGVAGESAVFEVEAVWFDNRHLAPSEYAARPPGEEPGPFVVTMQQPNSLLLRANQGGTFRLSYFLMPAPGATCLPDFLFDQHVEAIASGATARLLAMPGKEWSNPQFAAIYQATFEREADRNFRASQRGQQRAPTRMRFRDV